jgi:phthiodiolone/phenolphthiodiolone dimycocerosates ketoreductase
VTTHIVETAVTVDISRHIDLRAFAQMTKLMQETGVVDYVHMSDQLVSWFPREMWTPENTPMAAVVSDIDSFPDPFVLGAYGLASAPDVGVSLTTDSLRRGAPELAQTLLTLSNLSNRPPILQMGAGEIKQCKPFGHKRSQGLSRLEDHYRAFNAFWTSAEPFELSGNHLNYHRAWIGDARGQRPRFWGLGGGPQFFDITTSYADGIGTAVPFVWATAEQAAEEIQRHKKTLERKGRDPDEFTFGVWAVTALHEDPEVLEQARRNPLLRWLAAIFGRLNQADWLKEGLTPPFPTDWHYALKLLPMDLTAQQVHDIIDPISDKVIEKSWFSGTPAEVAAEFQAYVDAGVDWLQVYDILPIYLQPEEAATAHLRSIEVCRILKANAGAGGPVSAGHESSVAPIARK